MIIHNNSHKFGKFASFRCYIHRLLNIPLSPAEYEKEVKMIKQIAVNNVYEAKLIDQMIDKKLFKQAIHLVYQTPREKFKKLHHSHIHWQAIRYRS